MPNNWSNFTTSAIHAGQDYNQWQNKDIVPPIITSATFFNDDPTIHGEYCYTRLGNPTRTVVENAIAALDKGAYGLTFSSGSAAMTTIIQSYTKGDHIICALEMYCGNRELILHHSNLHGTDVDFVDMTNMEVVREAIRPNTKLIWIETPSNPTFRVFDIKAIADVAHANRNILVAVDNTVLTSYYLRPLELGADVVLYSLSKFMNGHNDVLMGALVMNDQQLYDKYLFHRTCYGAIPSTFECYLMNRSLKTLPMRMEQHNKNATAIANFLESHPNVIKVKYPGLKSHPQYELSKRQCSGHGGLLTFQVAGTVKQAKHFIQQLRLVLSSSGFGSFSTFISMPTIISYSIVPEGTLQSLDIHDTTLRMSVGFENSDEIIKDLAQAFAATYSN